MIILAKMEETGLVPTGKYVQRGRNLFPEMQSVEEPHALLFCQKELKGDRERAKAFAEAEGYQVYTNFPKGTRVDKAIKLAKQRIARRR